MLNYKVWAYDVISSQEVELFIDHRSLLYIHWPAIAQRKSFQLSDVILLKISGEFGLEIRSNAHNGLSTKYDFESTEVRDEFASRVRRASKKHEKVMEGILMELSLQKLFFLKYNYKDSKQSKKYFWFSADLNEIRWAPTIASKKFSKVSIFEINDVIYGPQSKNFQRAMGRSDGRIPPYHLCITLQTYKKTIDLQAPDEKQLKIWLTCLHYILQSKSVPIQSHFTLNKFVFIRFKLKMSQAAHKFGLTFQTYLKLKLNKAIYSMGSPSPQLIVSRMNNKSAQDTSRLAQIQEKAKRSFIHHKRTSTLPMHPGSYDDKRAASFNAQLINAGSLYTDRRSQINELSRHSSASNVSLHHPMSQRIEQQGYHSTNSPNPNFNSINKTIEVDYGLDSYHTTSLGFNNPAMQQYPNRLDPKFNESFPIQWNTNETDGGQGKPLHRPQQQSISGKINPGYPQETSINLYFNMDGSKEISGVLPQSQIEGPTTTKILPDNFNLDFTKITSPPAYSNNVNSTTQTTKAEPFIMDSKKHSPPSNESNISTHKETGSKKDPKPIKSREVIVDKENIHPNNIVHKKGLAKLMLMPLNLNKVINEKTRSSVESKSCITKEKEILGEHIKKERTALGSRDRMGPTRKSLKNIMDSDLSNNSHITTSTFLNNDKNQTSEISKSIEKSVDRTSSHQGIVKLQSLDSNGNNILKKRVKLTIDKKVLKAKLLRALQSSNTHPNNSNSNIVNQSFANEMIQANLSIDVSKIDLDLDTTSKSKVSHHEDKQDNQFTSRFRNEVSEDSTMLRRRDACLPKGNMDHSQDGQLVVQRTVTLGVSDQKGQNSEDVSLKKSRLGLSLDTSLINLENENIILKQHIEEMKKERDAYKEKFEAVSCDLDHMRRDFQSELSKKEGHMSSLIRSMEALEKEKEGFVGRISKLVEDNASLIAKENHQATEVYKQEMLRKEEMHGLQGKIHELEDVFRRMNDELEMYRREGNITLDESEELKEAYSKLSQDKDVYKRRVLSPKLSIDMLSSGRNKQLKDENDLLKESLEKEKQVAVKAIEGSRRLKRENEEFKKRVKSKLMNVQAAVKDLKMEKMKLLTETQENYQGFEEVWPHLLNIFEYQSKYFNEILEDNMNKGSQNISLDIKCFTLSKENELLRQQLKKKIGNSE